MEGERRKRKIEREEESEEQQMEKFFALIKSTRDVRDRLSKEKEEEKAKAAWKPTFQPQDFMEDKELAKINVLPNQPSAPSVSGKDTEEDAAIKESTTETEPQPQAQNENNNKPSDDLDLKLSL